MEDAIPPPTSLHLRENNKQAAVAEPAVPEAAVAEPAVAVGHSAVAGTGQEAEPTASPRHRGPFENAEAHIVGEWNTDQCTTHTSTNFGILCGNYGGNRGNDEL